MMIRGRVENGVVDFENGSALLEDTVVEVTAMPAKADRRGPVEVSRERQEALRGLIWLWRVENSPSDEEVERIIDEARMKKYN